MYTKEDGILSSLLKFNDYQKLNKIDVVCLTETKLMEEIKLGFIKEGYNAWRKDRNGVGGWWE